MHDGTTAQAPSSASDATNIFTLYAAFLLHHLPRISAVAIYNQKDAGQHRRYQVLKQCLSHIRGRPGLNLEFGVYKGASLKVCHRLCPNEHFFGFDSFEGFPDDQRTDWDQDFATASLPEIPGNCSLVKGFFEDTLPSFLEDHPEALNFVNIDCDIYSSTDCILFHLERAKRIRPDLVILFDELINYREFVANEMLALFKFHIETGHTFKWLASHGPVRFLDDYLDLIESNSFPEWGQDKVDGYRQQVAMVIRSKSGPPDYLRQPHIAQRSQALGTRLKSLFQKQHPDKLRVLQDLQKTAVIGNSSTPQPKVSARQAQSG